ncbi:UPF0462 protein C4orf33 homolog [Carassius carassius]|uniref:UPF0462 protein C4orf33 homolog n=1 Tax=Carassius carassius TaxID=217509 RepID=UPI00286978E3|nr:UPF0462 protein C4orf33 homolog [Carassius carassius]
MVLKLKNYQDEVPRCNRICVCVGCILLTVMEFHIKHSWDSLCVDHKPVKIRFSPGEDGLLMQFNAPFFNDPPAPAGPPGEQFPGLWDYEVVETFFLNSYTEQYLEVEVCPHGQHLILLLNGKQCIYGKKTHIVHQHINVFSRKYRKNYQIL